MRLYKPSGSSSWHVDYMDHTGARIRRSLRTTVKGDARELLKELFAKEEHRKATKNCVSLAEALDNYHASLVSQGKPSAYNVAGLIRKLLGRREPPKVHPKRGIGSRPARKPYAEPKLPPETWHLKPDMMLHDLRPIDLETLNRERRREGLSAHSIAHELKTLRAATRYAKELGYAVPAIDKWRLPKLVDKTRYLSHEEFALVVKELTPSEDASPRIAEHRQNARDLLVLLVSTGGRWSEIAGLTWDKVNLAEGSVMLWGNKTQKERSVPLNDTASAILQRRLGQRIQRCKWVFPGPVPRGKTVPMEPLGSCRQITDAIERAGLNNPDSVAKYGRATIHSLRHTYASWLLAGGADLADVQIALGHTTLQMARRYVHLTRAQAHDRLANAFSAGSPELAVAV